MLFSGWLSLGRMVVVGLLAYICLILLLRISGKRTLAKMNAFDLVVTVALGSTLSAVAMSKDVALAEGGAASRCSNASEINDCSQAAAFVPLPVHFQGPELPRVLV